MKVFVSSRCVKSYGVWSVVSVASISVRDDLLYLFLLYSQVGVGIKGGLEDAIHSIKHFLYYHKDNPDLCTVKLDMYNAFNEVQ